ncbi:MAG: site-specific DNA-methyltransferase [Candidatus Bathyarchaeota archaeon]|jgi:site-specific DNA-methyltransferase (adenine-specific)
MTAIETTQKRWTHEDIRLIQGDCIDVMDSLIEEGIVVDAIITDPPYGTTACKWDSVIPFDEMWQRLNKLIKPNGAIVLFGSEPFSSALRMSNLTMFKYDHIWVHNRSANFAQAPYRPLGMHETVSVFSKGGNSKNSKTRMCYYPQGLVELKEKKVCNSTRLNGRAHRSSKAVQKDYVQKYTNYPNNILEYKKESAKYHPTQKPVALIEYLIKTYTKENELVLDFTMGSGTTGVAARNLNRKFIGIELDSDYYAISNKRLEQVQGGLF